MYIWVHRGIHRLAGGFLFHEFSPLHYPHRPRFPFSPAHMEVPSAVAPRTTVMDPFSVK